MASSFFWNLISKSYIASPVPDQAVYEAKLDATRARLQSDWKMLEVGCGSGNTAMALAPQVAHVTAVDFSEKMLAYGREQAEKRGLSNVTFACQSLDDVAVHGETYDAVLMHSLLHLIPDWKRAVSQAAALTRANGIFVSSTACIADQTGIARHLPALMRFLPILPSLASISKAALVAEILSHGFEIELETQPSAKDAVFILARKKP